MKITADIIQGFVNSVLSKRFDGAVSSPNCHREWWELCCSDNRFVAIAAPRGHAKSTAITLAYGLSCLLFRERAFALVVSDTESQAVMFLGAIKQELQENVDIIELFGLKKNEKGEVDFVKDTETDIIVEFEDGHRFRIVAKGSEQKLRGLLWSGKRPDLILCDDMENDELVMNQDRREKFSKWFYGALLPCRSDRGVVRMVGTILHMDSLLENLMPKTYLKTTVEEELKIYSTQRSMWKSVKYKAHNPDFSEILWPEKKSKEELQALRRDHTEKGISEVYSREYLNIPIDESTAYFKKGDFLPVTAEDAKCKLLYYLTCDLAISQKERADYSVFMVSGVDENKKIQVRNVIRERMDGREIVDTLIALQKVYDFEAVGIEEGQISKAIGPFLREAMVATGIYLSLLPLKHMGVDKIQRARSIQARVRAHGVRFDRNADWYQVFEDECTRFPKDKHDDQVDAFSYLGLMLDNLIEAPTLKEMDEDNYRDEYEKSQLSEQGRNAFTGY